MRLFALAAVAVALAAPTAASTAASPTLRLASQEPFVVTGRGFGVGEIVRVVAIYGAERRVKTVAAGTAGGLRARFGFAARTCALIRVSATGSRGSRAALRIVPACQPDAVP